MYGQCRGPGLCQHLFGDSRIGAKDRFNFNVFLHLSILGSICYLVGGFGWPRTMEIDRSKFAHPRLYTVLSPAWPGPVANLLLAGIAASVVSLMRSFEWDPMVFLMVIGVNVTTAIYNLVPIPPLAMGSLVCELIPEEAVRTRSLFLQIGPFPILALVLLERLTNQGIFSPYLDPLIKSTFAYFQRPLITDGVVLRWPRKPRGAQEARRRANLRVRPPGAYPEVCRYLPGFTPLPQPSSNHSSTISTATKK